MKWMRKLAKWFGMTLGAFFILLIGYATVTLWPPSDQWLYARGLEELEDYIQDHGLKPRSDLRLCGFLPADDEPNLRIHFVCSIDLVGGTLNYDVAFTTTGAIEYKDSEVTDP